MQCSSMLLSAVEILDFPFLVVDKSRSLDASCTQNGLKLELLEIMRACYLCNCPDPPVQVYNVLFK